MPSTADQLRVILTSSDQYGSLKATAIRQHAVSAVDIADAQISNAGNQTARLKSNEHMPFYNGGIK